MTDRAASLARIAHWLDQQDAEYITPLAVEPPHCPPPWIALWARCLWLSLLTTLLLVLNEYGPWWRSSETVALIGTIILFGIFVWGLVAVWHDWRVARRMGRRHL